MTNTMSRIATQQQSEPAWDVARLFPSQGQWSEQEYLALPTNHLVEFSDGRVEVLPMPTTSHQRIVLYLYRLLASFLEVSGRGSVLTAPLPVRLWEGKYREPDVVVMLAEHEERIREQYWDVPDLVIEVVSPVNRAHDTEIKRREYAQAGIPEYWIVDPEEATITVLTLGVGEYVVDGAFAAGETVQSRLLSGFEVSVDDVWAAAREKAGNSDV